MSHAGPRMSPVNITHFVENLERGGLERVVIDLVQAQREAGHDCRVICLFQRGALASELSARGVEVHACNKRRGIDLGAILRARALLRARPGGVLHTHNATAHYHAVLAAIGLPIARVVNTRHGMGASDPSSRGEWLYRGSMRLTDMVVAVCESAREQFSRYGVRPRTGLVSVPNGIRVDRFTPASDEARQQLAARLGFAPGTRMIGTVGRLSWAKDQANLIRAFRIARESIQDSALLLIGDGALRSELEATAREEGVEDAIRFLGDRDDVDQLLRGLDLFVLSSLTEGYSVALLEACASALPIVATDVGGNAEIVANGINGRLVAPGDPGAMAREIVALLRDRRRADLMGRAGREWVLDQGSFRSMAARYSVIYAG